jgi:hypothetical protein
METALPVNETPWLNCSVCMPLAVACLSLGGAKEEVKVECTGRGTACGACAWLASASGMYLVAQFSDARVMHSCQSPLFVRCGLRDGWIERGHLLGRPVSHTHHLLELGSLLSRRHHQEINRHSSWHAHHHGCVCERSDCLWKWQRRCCRGYMAGCMWRQGGCTP